MAAYWAASLVLIRAVSSYGGLLGVFRMVHVVV